MKKYYVSRNMIVPETCAVMAKNKKEAIIKAENGDFAKNEFEEDEGWEIGATEKIFKKFEVWEEKE